MTESSLPRGTALGRFVVLALVGRGAMGEVYAAYDPELDRKIAIKVLRARTGGAGDAADSRARLLREAQATAKISHPNVVVVYDAGTVGDRVFIAMEFLEGHTLRYWLQAKERTWHEVLEAFLTAGRGLAAAHDHDFVHRDFKPDNVMVSSAGQVRVMDFGLARVAATRGEQETPADFFAQGPQRDLAAIDFETTAELGTPLPPFLDGGPAASDLFRDKITVTGAVVGTPAYMSPEQFRSQPADARSDQFSFCVALYEALYGARPFAGRTLQDLAENVQAGRVSEPPPGRRVPASVRRVLERGLRAEPELRFPSMNALLTELEKLAGTHAKGFASGASAKLAGVWENPLGGHPVETPEKEAMRAAFLATGKPYAAAAFATASGVLDRYAQSWTELYIEICEATHVRGEQSSEVLDLRMDALSEGLEDLKALCRMFRSATGQVVENAVNAANQLGALERCRDIKLLRAVVRPPDDPAVRAAVDELRVRLIELRAILRVGRVAEGLAQSDGLLADARAVGYGAILAEILLVRGNIFHEGGRPLDEAIASLEEAVWTAETARHDEVSASAASALVYFTGYLQNRFDVAEIWSRHTEALLRRLGGHDQLWGWYFTNRACMRERQGRLDDAIADARAAAAAKERALGPDSPDLALSIGNLANHYAFGGAFAEAIEASQRAVDMATVSLGLDHPRAATMLANHGQYLYRLGRHDEALRAAERALVTFERETNPKSMWVTFPLRTIGLALIGRGDFEAAVPSLERVVEIREAIETNPVRLADAHFALAQALGGRDGPGDAARALALAVRARDEYARSPRTPLVALDTVALERWLAVRAPTAA